MQNLLQAELSAVAAYCEAAMMFRAAGFPGLACWAEAEAKSETEHALRVARWIGSRGASAPHDPKAVVDEALHALVAKEIDIRDAYLEEVEAADISDKAFLDPILEEQIRNVAEAVAMEVRGVLNPVALDLEMGDA